MLFEFWRLRKRLRSGGNEFEATRAEAFRGNSLSKRLVESALFERRLAAARLGNLRDVRGIRELILAVTYPGGWADTEAAYVDALSQIDSKWSETPVAAAAVQEVAKILSAHTPSHQRRWQICVDLSKIRCPQSAAALCVALRDKSIMVRQAAAHGLGRLGDRVAVPDLIAAMEQRSRDYVPGELTFAGDVDYDVHRFRQDCVAALSEVGVADRNVLAFILRSIGSPGHLTVETIDKALKRIDPRWNASDEAREAIPLLVQVLDRAMADKFDPSMKMYFPQMKDRPDPTISISSEFSTPAIDAAWTLGKIGEAMDEARDASRDRLIAISRSHIDSYLRQAAASVVAYW